MAPRTPCWPQCVTSWWSGKGGEGRSTEGNVPRRPVGFHLWLSLPAQWTRSAFVGHTRSTGVSVVASDAFATEGTPPEAVRVCLGGPADSSAVRSALEFMAHALAELPTLASTFL